MNIAKNIEKIQNELPETVTLVAVSKTKPITNLQEAYQAGQRIFGENKIQEMTDKWQEMPKDIRWHMIGHVQRNKVKYMAAYVDLIHGVDSIKLLKEINKQAEKFERKIDCLLQIHIAEEETKFGMDEKEVTNLLASDEIKDLPFINIIGLMGMATFTNDENQIRKEFKSLKTLFDKLKPDYPTLEELSMGMSGDYKIAIEEGSTMVRVGSRIFGERNYNK
ncbi:YggS family pyridoxal phosphate-dependent enzyme [Zhouia sp. PK063]|uniref:YggS family pyridoxal phosphate-dependent enzyme n=1 Tax=Zhouia sp. PK063 TaxID=3373602 RepID=UPI0037B38055